jgi:hypothetical protein
MAEVPIGLTLLFPELREERTRVYLNSQSRRSKMWQEPTPAQASANTGADAKELVPVIAAYLPFLLVRRVFNLSRKPIACCRSCNSCALRTEFLESDAETC